MTETISGTNQQLYSFSSKIGTQMPSYYPWKGKSFHQIVSTMQKNTVQLDISGRYQNYQNLGTNSMRAQPLKIYRREIASVPLTSPQVPRTGVSIDELNRPGGTITVQSYTTKSPTGLDGIIVDAQEAGASSNSTEHPGQCASFSSKGMCMTQETNARRRCRSSGIMKHNYNSSASQYLTSRNKTFQQNQFNFLTSGDKTSVPGSASAISNVYASQGTTFTQMIYDASGMLSSCTNMKVPRVNVVYKPNNSRFAQQGGVSSGSYILSKKFDTITNNVAIYRKIYGNSVASAMGYGISDSVYTFKGKHNFPEKRIPTFPKKINPTFSQMIPCTDCSIK